MPLLSTALLLTAAPQTPYQMTTAEVQRCGAQIVERNRQIAAFEQSDAALLAEQNDLATRQAALSAMAGKVDTKKKKDVADYNAMTTAFNTAVAAHHEKVVARNTAKDELPKLDAAYNASCSHRSMNPADVAALPADQRALMSAGAKTTTVMAPAPPAARRKRP